MRDQAVPGVEGEPEAANAAAGEEIARRERPIRFGRGEVAHPPRVHLVPDPGISGVERRREFSGLIRPERPRLLDLSVRVDAIKVEPRHGHDLGCRGVCVLQDLAGLRRFSEEVSPPFARGQPVGEETLTRSRLPGENGRRERHENQEAFSPSGSTRDQCSGSGSGRRGLTKKAPVSGGLGSTKRKELRGDRR